MHYIKLSAAIVFIHARTGQSLNFQDRLNKNKVIYPVSESAGSDGRG